MQQNALFFQLRLKKVLLCVTAEANFFLPLGRRQFFLLIDFNWNILINWRKTTKGSHTHFTNLVCNIPNQIFFPCLARSEFFLLFLGIPEGIPWNPHSDIRKKSLKKKFSAGGGQVFRSHYQKIQKMIRTISTYSPKHWSVVHLLKMNI